MNNDKDIDTQEDKKDSQGGETSKPIDTPEKVPASNDEKIDQDFPGYPHYPAQEDLLNPENNNGRLDADVENLTRAHNIPQGNLEEAKDISSAQAGEFPLANPDEDDADLGIVAGTEADVTAEDLLLLGDPDKDMDLDEDEQMLTDKAWPLDMTGEDLDIPEADLDDERDAIGQGDEENSYYSIGGDNHDNLEESSNTY